MPEAASKNKTIPCPACGESISPKAIVCSHCGTLLRELGEDASKTAIMPRPPGTDKLGFEEESTSSGTSRFAEGSVLYLSIERVNSPITRYVHHEPIILGRANTGALGRNDIDLNPYNAKERGVSRRHAQIYFADGEIYLEDLESSNGTVVNGETAEVGKPIKLRDGDEIMLGRMMVWVNF